ncbi:MAG: AMP-binding protein [Candidatus Xenobia bacterium]
MVSAIARERGRRWEADGDAASAPLDLDSLERAELLLRIERTFNVRLPDSSLAARTVGDLVAALQNGTLPVHGTALPRAPLPPIDSPAAARTLIDVIRFHAESHGDRLHLTWLRADGDEVPLRYDELWEQSRRAAFQLQAAGIRAGDRVALMLPTSLEYFYAFSSALLLGAAVVPLYPPFRLDRLEEFGRRQAQLLRHARTRLLVTTRALRSIADLIARPTLILDPAAPLLEAGPIDAEAPALVQYTSGSTAMPKGVVLSHRNLLVNIRAIGEAAAFCSEDVMVSWLPLYHDMGLIGSWMCSLYYGMPLALMGPERFLFHPDRWVWAIHRFGGTISPNPNFAYEMAARLPEEATEGLNLASWRLAMNGAEPVQAATIDRFTSRYARHGFRPEAMYPVYGLAENSLAVSFSRLGERPRIDVIDREQLEQHGRAVPASDGLSMVGCGKPLPGVEVRIADASGKTLPERTQGRVWFRSRSTMQGYLHNPEASREVMRADGWLDSGDLGYLAEGDLVLCGRARDLIIRGGRNMHPQEIEEVARAVPGVRPGGIAAFGVEGQGTEAVVVVVETREGARAAVTAAVGRQILDALGFAPDAVVAVAPGCVPRTSSGKVRRGACRELYLSGRLEMRRPPPWWQIARWTLSHWARNAWAAFCWGVSAACAMPPLVTALVTRDPHTVMRVAHPCAQAIFRLTGLWPKLQGERFPDGPAVFVANHQSYLDGMMLVGLIPAPFLIVTTRTVLEHPVSRVIVPRMPVLLVSSTAAENLEVVSAMAAALKRGERILIFPEGLNWSPGLKRFALGGFRAAAEAQVPIVPIAIDGACDVLPAGCFIPRPGKIAITVCSPVQVASTNFEDVVAAAEAARTHIASALGLTAGP